MQNKCRTAPPAEERGAQASLAPGSPPENGFPEKCPPPAATSSPPQQGPLLDHNQPEQCFSFVGEEGAVVAVPPPTLPPSPVHKKEANEVLGLGEEKDRESALHGNFLLCGEGTLLVSPFLFDAAQISAGYSFGKAVYRKDKKIAASEELQEAFPKSAFHLTGSGRGLFFGRTIRGHTRIRANGHHLLRTKYGLPIPDIEGPTNQFLPEERALLWDAKGEADLVAQALGELDRQLHKLDTEMKELIAREFPEVADVASACTPVLPTCEFGFEIGPYPIGVLEEIEFFAERAARAVGGVTESVREWPGKRVKVLRFRIENPSFSSGEGEKTFMKVYIKRNYVRIEIVFNYPQPSGELHERLMDRLVALAFWAQRKLENVKQQMTNELRFPQRIGPEDVSEILKAYGYEKQLAYNLRWREFEKQISFYGTYSPAELQTALRLPPKSRNQLSDSETGVLEEKKHFRSSGHGGSSYFLLRPDWREQIKKYKMEKHGKSNNRKKHL